jgi:hypothetical protein
MRLGPAGRWGGPRLEAALGVVASAYGGADPAGVARVA